MSATHQATVHPDWIKNNMNTTANCTAANKNDFLDKIILYNAENYYYEAYTVEATFDNQTTKSLGEAKTQDDKL